MSQGTSERPMRRRELRWPGFTAAALLAAGCLGAPAWAHDSWLRPAGPGEEAGPALRLGTGNRYPRQEFGSLPEHLVQANCTDGLQVHPMSPGVPNPHYLPLRLPASEPGHPPLSCWAELHPVEVELAPAVVDVYFDDIRAGPALRERWDAMRQRGLPWRETYRKFARIDLRDDGAEDARRETARHPVGLPLEAVLLGGRPVVAGEPVTFQVLRDGQPLADLPVELVSERSRIGIWRVTDAHGLVRQALPFAGRWLLRGTQLVPEGERWRSRFVTLAFEAS